MTHLELVRAYLEATNPAKLDLERLRPLLADDFTAHDTMMGTTTGADTFVEQLRGFGSNPSLKRQVDGAISQGEQAAALVRLQLGDAEVTFLQWFTLEGGALKSVRVVYDPRPFLAMQR